MEKTSNQKIRLGIFVIFGTLVFIAAIYFIGSKQLFFGNTENLKATFDNVNGLQLGNNVRFSGVNIGTVRKISIVNDTTISVEMAIDEKIFPLIKKDALASIGSDGLVGNMIINITSGKTNSTSVTPGGTINSIKKIRTEELLNTLSLTNKNASLLSNDLLKISNEIANGKGTLGLLLNDTVMASDLKLTLHYLKLSSKGTNQSIEILNRTLANLDNKNNVIGVLKDSAVANNIKKVIQNLNKSSSDINAVVANLNSTVTNLKDGKGAINYLANDPKLVTKIDSTMTNINQASFKLNQNMEALKHNFLFKGYFKKQEKEQKKMTKN